MITPPKYTRKFKKRPKVSRRNDETGELEMVPMKQRPNDDQVFRRLEHSIPRTEWISIMECAGDDKRVKLLLQLLMEPKYRKRTLPWMAMQCGLSYAEVVILFKNHKVGEGTIRMSKHIPQAMEDIAVDSLSKEVTCGNCKGHFEEDADGAAVASVPVTEVVTDDKTGKSQILQKLDADGKPMWERCLVCDGVGTLRKVGDAKSRSLMFETLGLIKQPGPLVAVQNNFGGATSMEDSVGAAHAAIDVPLLKEATNEAPPK